MDDAKYRLAKTRYRFWSRVRRTVLDPIDLLIAERQTDAACDVRDIEMARAIAQVRLMSPRLSELEAYCMAEQVRSVALGHYPYNAEASDEAKRIAAEIKRAGIRLGDADV